MKYKINRNRPPLDDGDFARAKDFNKALKGYQMIKTPFYRSGKFLTRGSAIIVAIAVGFIVLFSDGPDSPQAFISPPIAQADIIMDSFTVEAEAATEIDYKSGSKIYIPVNTFKDANGNPVKGKVTLKYREFHNQKDIFLSGIPMTYDSAGSSYVFESAGMMEITASQNNKELKLNPANPIKVEMISNTAEDKYNTYYLDTLSKKWVNLNQVNLTIDRFKSDNTRVPDTSSELIKWEQQLNNTETALKTIDKEKPTFIAKSDKAKIKFHIDVDTGEFPEIAMYKGVCFQVRDEKDFNPGSAKTQWEDVKLKKLTGIDYEIIFTKGNQTFKIIATPVVDDKDMPAARTAYDKKFAEYGFKRKEKIAAEEKAKNELKRIMADRHLIDSMVESGMSKSNLIYRTFSVNNFGFYNCDCPRINQSDANVIAVLTDGSGKALKLSELCLVEKGINMICSYHSVSRECENFKFNSTQDNALWGVTTENKLVVVDTKSFKIQQATSGRVTFRFNVIDKDIHSTAEAKKYLDI